MALATFLRLYRLNWTWQLLIRRHCSQLPLQESASSSGKSSDQEPPPQIPLVPKRRDPSVVLKALASTIEKVEHESFRGIGMADPLHPVKKGIKMDYIQHYEAGRKAAKYVMYRWPKLFRFKKLDSDPVEWERKPLERTIARKRPYQAIWIYNKKMEEEEEVSLETKNALLALVAYRGLGSGWATANDAAEVISAQEDMSWWPVGQSEEQDKHRGAEQEIPEVELSEKKIKDGVKIWRLDNTAEKLFQEISEKNTATYEALIQGLVKHRNYKRAFEIFDTMRSEGSQATVQTYNLLLSALNSQEESLGNTAWNKGMHLLKHMSTEPVALPNTCTFDLLLQLANANFSAVELSGRVMREMFHIGVKPSLTTFYWLLKIYAVRKPESVFVLKEIVEYLEKNPQTVCIQDRKCYVFFGEAMVSCLKMENASLAMRLMAVVENSGNFDIVNNVHSFVGTYLRVLTLNLGNFEVLISEYNRLVPFRYVPYEWLYRIFFERCTKVRNVEFAVKLLEDIEKYRVNIEEVRTLDRFCNVIGEAVILAEHVEKLSGMVERRAKLLQEKGSQPSSHIINTLIKLAYVGGHLDKMWEYYGMFEKTKNVPSFISLFQMLKAYYGSSDTESIIWIIEEMIKRDMSLDLHYLGDICMKSNIDEDTYYKLRQQFERPESRPVGVAAQEEDVE